MRKIKRLVSIALTSVMLFTLAGCDFVKRTEESKGKTVLAKVDGEKITRDDVDKLLAYTLNSYKSYYGDDYENNDEIKDQLKELREQALDSLVAEKVLMAKKDDLKVKYTDEEIEEEADESVSYYKQYYTDDDKFLEFIKSYGYKNEKEFKKYWEKQAKLSRIAEAMVKDVKVTDKDIEEFYNKNIDSYTLNPGAYVTHVVFTDESTGEADAKAARELVLQGKTFEEIAEMDEYKDKCKYEDLGHQDFENNSSLVSEFVDGFKNLPEGQVSEPVKTSYGWHLILTSNINSESVTQSLDDVKDEVESTVLNEKKSEEYTKKLKKYKKEIGVKTYKDRI